MNSVTASPLKNSTSTITDSAPAVSMDFWRQLDVISPNQLEMPITIIGAGGIGSPTALALTKMGVTNLTIYDDDKIDNHNLPNQIYKLNTVGETKVECLKSICKEFAGVDVNIHVKKFDETKAQGIIISAVDSMKSRIEIWNLLKYRPLVTHYIDARMAAEIFYLYTTRPCNSQDIEMYEQTLYTDENSVEERCTEKSVIYNVFGISSFICNQIKRLARNEEYYKEIIFDYKTPMLLTNLPS